MKHLLSLCGLIAASSLAHAGSVDTRPGASFTANAATHSTSVFAARTNPAMAGLAVGKDEALRLNYLPALTLGLEVGDVTDFVDELDELVDILDDPSLAQDSVEETLDRFNTVLVGMGDYGYLKQQNTITAPITPIFWRPSAFSGTFFMELEMNTSIYLGILDNPLEFNEQNMNFTTASAAYLKSGIEKRLSLGYSRPLFGEQRFAKYGGQLLGGIKLSAIHMELSKQVMGLQHLDGRDIEDVIEDEYKENLRSSTGFSIDLGLVWVASRYRLGLTLSDINSPSFDYGPVGMQCDRYDEGSIGRNNCDTATFFALEKGEIATEESHTKHAVGSLDGAFYITPRWSLGASFDLAAADDLVGTANQWLHVSTNFDAPGMWLPDLRLGYRENLEGSELSTVLAGLTLFDTLTLDLEMALDKVVVDGSQAPRKAAIALSFSERF